MVASALELPDRNRMAVAHINRHALRHGVAVDRVRVDQPVDRSRLFTCPTLAPLAHSPVWRELSEPQQLRYNQLAGLLQNELICFFEQEIAARVLPAMLRGAGAMPVEMVRSLEQFLLDEQRHTQMFRRLNRLAEPGWYAAGDYHILRLAPAMLLPGQWIAGRPAWFPMVYWIMLLMEERSLMISRRYATVAPQCLDPLFAETYRAHAEDEMRHVQIDWHLLERFYVSRPRWLRRVNAKMLEWTIVGLFLKPRRANVRLIDLLIGEFPELAERRGDLVAAVYALETNAGYRRMMYSTESTPIGRALFERLPEFARLRDRLYKAGPA